MRVEGRGFGAKGSASFLVSGLGSLFPGFGFQAMMTSVESWLLTIGFGFRASGSGFRVPGPGFWIPVSGFRVSGFGFRRL